MARRYRQGMVTFNEKISTGLADGDVTTVICAPSEGAVIDNMLMTVSTAGVGGATAVVNIQERGTTKSLGTGSFTLATAAKGVHQIFGNGVGATNAGVPIDINFVFTSTTTTAATVICTVTWLA